ncbi:tetratricopeptide repeat protein [Marinobacterium maritimum]|uniref:Tetratricopeptide repeat protein n=1 Tax=Marinobacterium maritimum TaxID=500162 RepID=A0ABP3T9J8_9GAMM
MSVPSLNEALALMNQSAFPVARAICQQHLAQRPDDFNARHLLGLIQFKAGNLLGATKELTKASKLNPGPRFQAQALNNLALVLQARGKREQAVEACRTALQLQPQELAFHLNLLGLLEQLQCWHDIVDHLKGNPELAHNDEAQLCHAVAARHLDHHQTALDILARLRNSVEVESERALNLCLLGNSQAAIANWKATGASPEFLVQLADYIAEEGFATAATPLYQVAALTEPDNLSVRHMLDAAQGQCTPEAPSDYVRNLYDTHAEQFESRLQDRLGYNAPERLCQHLTHLITADVPIDAVDLGCGTGLCGVELRKQLPIANLSGCDLSPRMLQLAASKEAYDTLSCSSLLDYLASVEPVQLITATDVLIYTGNLKPVIETLPRALKPGGYFAFTVELNSDDSDVSLHSSGRYRHSQHHIEALATQYSCSIQLLEAFPLRTENDVVIEGLMVILQRA